MGARGMLLELRSITAEEATELFPSVGPILASIEDEEARRAVLNPMVAALLNDKTWQSAPGKLESRGDVFALAVDSLIGASELTEAEDNRGKSAHSSIDDW